MQFLCSWLPIWCSKAIFEHLDLNTEILLKTQSKFLIGLQYHVTPHYFCTSHYRTYVLQSGWILSINILMISVLYLIIIIKTLRYYLTYNWTYFYLSLPSCLSYAVRVCGSPCTWNHTHARQVGICRHSIDNVHIDKHSGTIFVISAKHWLWLPDDGSCMNQNMLEQFLDF